MTTNERLAIWALLGFSLLAAAGRLTVPGRPLSAFGWPLTYEALAHLWCGVLLGAACFAALGGVRRLSWACLGVLALYEALMFAFTAR